MKNFKKWLIRKLGGIVPSDLSTRLRVEILNYQSDNSINQDMANLIKNGFRPSYSSFTIPDTEIEIINGPFSYDRPFKKKKKLLNN